MNRVKYVLLEHAGMGETHVDLMFETTPGSMLRSYRLPTWPIVGEVVAEAIGDHRREYLTHEGEVAGDRGTVRQVAAGTVVADIDEDLIRMFPIAGKPAELTLRRDADGRWSAKLASLHDA